MRCRSWGDSKMIAQQGPIMLYDACCAGQVAHQVVSIGIPKKSEATCQFCVVWNITLQKGLQGILNGGLLRTVWRYVKVVRVFPPISSNNLLRVEGARAMKSKGCCAWQWFCQIQYPSDVQITRFIWWRPSWIRKVVKSQLLKLAESSLSIIWRGHHRRSKEVSRRGKSTWWDGGLTKFIDPRKDLATWQYIFRRFQKHNTHRTHRYAAGTRYIPFVFVMKCTSWGRMASPRRLRSTVNLAKAQHLPNIDEYKTI